jgi:hypothetical protein
MQTRVWPRLLLVPLAAVALLAAACGGDDSQAQRRTREATTTTQPAATPGQNEVVSQRLDLDCSRDVRTFRFDGKLAVQSPRTTAANTNDPSALFASLLNDVKYSGAYVAPDRSQLRFEITAKDSPIQGQVLEFVQVGPNSYVRLGQTGWQQQSGPGGNPIAALDPRELCRDMARDLPADAEGRRDTLNGAPAIRYEFDRAALTRPPAGSGGGFLRGIAGSQDLPENAKMTLWVAEKEKFPLKMVLTASGQQAGQPVAVNFEMTIADLNGTGISIEAPRL